MPRSILEFAQPNIRYYGAVGNGVTDDSGAFQAAINDAPDRGVVNVPPAVYNLASTIQVSKAVSVVLGGGTIKGPASGFIFDISASGASIRSEGGRPKLIVNGAGGIRTTDAHRVEIERLDIDLNNKAGAIGVHHLGGWYVHLKDIWIDKTRTAADAVGLKVQCTNEGAGSQGAYVSLYENITAKRLVIEGANPRTVTTLTFINLDAANVSATLARCLTFIQPVIQQTGGTHITLRYVDGFTALGGDFEGSGTIYDIDQNCRGIVSMNNLYSGFSGTYRQGTAGAAAHWLDYSELVTPPVWG